MTTLPKKKEKISGACHHILFKTQDLCPCGKKRRQNSSGQIKSSENSSLELLLFENCSWKQCDRDIPSMTVCSSTSSKKALAEGFPRTLDVPSTKISMLLTDVNICRIAKNLVCMSQLIRKIHPLFISPHPQKLGVQFISAVSLDLWHRTTRHTGAGQ